MGLSGSTPGKGPVGEEQVPRARRRGVLGVVTLGALVLAVLAIVAVVVSGGTRETSSPPPVYSVVVPPGTGARVAAGEPVELLPSDLQLPVGTELVIENQDDETQEVGPFVVRAGETLRHRFATRGIYSGACTVHPDGQITITVF